jgi:hypothetical protein
VLLDRVCVVEGPTTLFRRPATSTYNRDQTAFADRNIFDATRSATGLQHDVRNL